MFVILVLLIALLIANVRIVQQTEEMVIERLGSFKSIWGHGIHIKIPFIDRIINKVSLKEQVADFPPQPVITKDNVTMQIDTVVYFKIVDSRLYTYGVENPMLAIENLTATTLRNIVGDMELDETLTSRDKINSSMKLILDDATDPWGIKIERVELKNIIPPEEIQVAMEKQMKAEREKRELILRAEGEKKSVVLKAEGEKESAVLRAEAKKIELVREAEGQAESIRLYKEAEAAGAKALKKAGFDEEQIVRLRSLEAFQAAANGPANKIVIPSEIQNLTGIIEAVKEK